MSKKNKYEPIIISEEHEKRWNYFKNKCKDMVKSNEIAEYIEKIRNEGYTYRQISQHFYDKYSGDWYPTFNQNIGIWLCEYASEKIGRNIQ